MTSTDADAMNGAEAPDRLAGRPRLLFLCQTLPYPPDGGVHIRGFHLLRLLSRRYEVSAVCFYRRATRTTPAAVQAAADGLRRHVELASLDVYPIPQEYSRLRLLWDHGRSVLRRRAYTLFAYQSDAFRSRLLEILAEHRFDVIHIDSLDLADYVKDLPHSVAVVCDHHNVESALLERRAHQEPNMLKRRYFALQARLTRREESRWCGNVDLNLTVSTQDRNLLQEHAPQASVVVVPNGVDTTTFEPSYDGEDGIVFVGGYTWFPNKDGMRFFSERVLPRIREHRPNTSVRWVGRAPEAVVETYRLRYGVELTGYVDDIQPHVRGAACFVVPLLVGGGTRLKILDAWAMGKAVVSTSRGCEGLMARDGDNILIRDSADAFADAVLDVLSDADLRVRLGRGGRTSAETEYDWRKIGDEMLSAYEALASRHESR